MHGVESRGVGALSRLICATSLLLPRVVFVALLGLKISMLLRKDGTKGAYMR